MLVTGVAKIRPEIPSNWSVFGVYSLARFDSNILQLLGIQARILTFRLKQIYFFFQCSIIINF